MEGFYAHHFSVSTALCDSSAYLLPVAALRFEGLLNFGKTPTCPGTRVFVYADFAEAFVGVPQRRLGVTGFG